jgi:hypothetical protein
MLLLAAQYYNISDCDDLEYKNVYTRFCKII